MLTRLTGLTGLTWLTWAAPVAALLAAAAVALLLPASSAPARAAAALTGPRPDRWRLLLPVLAGAALLAFLEGRLLVLGAIGLGALAAGQRLYAGALAAKEAAARQDRVVEACEALAGELRAGLPVGLALRRTVEVWGELEPVAAAAALGADVPAALRRLATRAGAERLFDMAAAWQVCGDSGAGLSNALTELAAANRAGFATRRVVRAELASARATARLVAALPVVALVGSQGLGADPWQFLLETPVGLGCLAAGAALAFAGLHWIDRIAASVTRGC